MPDILRKLIQKIRKSIKFLDLTEKVSKNKSAYSRGSGRIEYWMNEQRKGGRAARDVVAAVLRDPRRIAGSSTAASQKN